MSDLILHKKNEAFIQFECDRGTAQELSDYFTFYVPGYQFTPAYKSRMWDGKIRLADLRTYTIYHGLVPYIETFCKERDYTLQIQSDINSTENYSVVEAEKFISTLNLPHQVRDYQLKSFIHAVRNKRILLLSPTASGKSLIIYLIVRWLQESDYKKGLLIVPTTSLVEQMYKDFADYGYDSDENCHRQYSGKEKHTNKFLTITTWQSIYKNDAEYFEQFDFVMGDEAHQFKAQSLTSIMTACTKTKYRIGLTGTLDGTKTHKLVLEGLFGPVKTVTTTKELIDNNQISPINIKCLVLKHPADVAEQSKDWSYQEEIQYLIACQDRNRFIRNLTISLNKNTLVLYQLVDKHGKLLYDMIKEKANGRQVFFVHGGVETEDREMIRSIMEKENDAIVVASYGTFSTGINIRNLHNIIFASPSKSRIRNLQSIGRGLRQSSGKESATLYDIADDLRHKKRMNFTLQHFVERVKIYNEEKFPLKVYNIGLKNGNSNS